MIINATIEMEKHYNASVDASKEYKQLEEEVKAARRAMEKAGEALRPEANKIESYPEKAAFIRSALSHHIERIHLLEQDIELLQRKSSIEWRLYELAKWDEEDRVRKTEA